MTDLEIICAVLQNEKQPMTAKAIYGKAQEVTGEPISQQANVNVAANNNPEIIYQYKAEQERNRPTKFWLYSELESIVLQIINEQLTGRGVRRKTEDDIKREIRKKLEQIDPSLLQSPKITEDVFRLFTSLCDSGKEINLNNRIRYLTCERGRYKLALQPNQPISAADDNSKLDDTESTKTQEVSINDLLEKDLHAVLAAFLAEDQHFTCYSKTIIAQGANRNNRDESKEWNYPDMVGVSYPFGKLREKHGQQMHEKSLELAEMLGTSSVMLFSFELKQSIDKSSLKQKYFQAVSNSSWANEGYLVAAEYKQLDKLINEMRRLASAFGIGFIRLNLHDFKNSEVLIPARSKDELDWITIDKLVKDDNSTQFTEFIASIIQNMKGRKIKTPFVEDEYMKRYTQEELFVEFQKSIDEQKEKKNK